VPKDEDFHFNYKNDMKLTGEDRYQLDQLENYDSMAWFLDVVKLCSGKSFGELALINDAPRAATIQCVTNCLFATLGRKDYQKIL
jgi:hypothetical protein